MARYRLRIYGAGEDGVTPPLDAQPCVLDVVVEATEEIPEDLRPLMVDGDRHLYVADGAHGWNGAYHGGPQGRAASVFTDRSRTGGAWEADVHVAAHGGLRAVWEPAA